MRTTYNLHSILLTETCKNRTNIIELERDWEWKDARDVLSRIEGTETRPFSVADWKRTYASTMMVVKAEDITMRPKDLHALTSMIGALSESHGALAMRGGGRSRLCASWWIAVMRNPV
ncbi:hypothetical protein GOODEAATRI_023039 [Goodea atripinnis]|uniref:Uncharacterized protein n=1 Tax=Goodea atripinnis TaxID=208336 RepID=A0ABV0NCX4_9TELE